MFDGGILFGGEVPIFAASFTLVAAYLFLRRSKSEVKEEDGKNYPPSAPILPVFATILRGGMTAVPAHFLRVAEKIGPVYTLKIGKNPVIILNSYEAIFDATHRHSEAYADRPPMFTDKKVMNKDLRGIIYTHYNDRYRKYHKICLSILREFGFGIKSESEVRILHEVDVMFAEIKKQNGRPIDPKWLYTYATSNVMIGILFGKNLLHALPKVHAGLVKGSAECMENIDMSLNLAPIFQYVPTSWKTIKSLKNGVKTILSAIDEGVEFIKTNSSEPTFVGRFLEIEGPNYCHEDLQFIVRDLCFGSTDTVSTTLLWTMVFLANNQEVLKKFQKELDEMVPWDRYPSLEDKSRLPYSEAVILEIMRIEILAPFMIPHATMKETTVLEYDIPKGCMVIPNGYAAHMDKTFWGDPETFRPERFLDADNNVINAHRVIPFGLGKRSCIGEVLARQSTFLFVTSLAQRFHILPPEGVKKIIVQEVSAVTTAPTPFKVRLFARDKPNQD
jgi:long-chain fatty acid omega-monooxygenase